MSLRKRHQAGTSPENDDREKRPDSSPESPSNSASSSSPILLERPGLTSCSFGSSSSSAGSPTRELSNDIDAPNEIADQTQLCRTRKSSLESFLEGCSAWAGNSYKTEHGIKLLQYLLWFFSKYAQHRKGGDPDVSAGLTQMCTQLSFTRFVLRLYGIPTSLHAIFALYKHPQNGGTGSIHQILQKTMAWSMLFYYPLEHIALAKWIAPKLPLCQRGPDAAKFCAWSCQFWLVYVLADIGLGSLKILELKGERRALMDDDRTEHDRIHRLETLDKTLKNLRLQFLRNILYTLPCIHWSLPDWDKKPWLKDEVLNGLNLVEALVCAYQSVWSLTK